MSDENKNSFDMREEASLLRFDELGQGKNQLTDLTNAELLIREYGDRIRFCPEWSKWLVWDGCVWKIDSGCRIFELAVACIRGMYVHIKTIQNQEWRQTLEKHLIKSESLRRFDSMLNLAGRRIAIQIAPKEIDMDGYLLNVKNGTIDLRTGELHEHLKENFISKCANVTYEKDARHENWNLFLLRIMDGNGRLIDFLQKAAGWALTGDMSEQTMFILYGSGANGKSTFLNMIMDILGEYAMSTPTESFMRKHSDGISNDIARLKGTRFVTSVEAEEGKSMSESLIKQVTGQDVLSARFLYGEFFDFFPTFKIFMATNHMPVIKGNDHGIWRRIKLVPFTVTIPYGERDPNLMEKLRQEKSGILNWMIEGCIRWQKEGLGTPEEVQTATDEYQEDMDTIATFLSECCVRDDKGYLRISSADLYRGYCAWCVQNSEHPFVQRMFAIHLQHMGVKKGRDMSTRYWKGIALKVDTK